MSLYGRERRKRVRYFRNHRLKSSDHHINGWHLWTHLLVPDPIGADSFMDYWAFNGRDVLLVTLVNSETRFVHDIKKIGPRDAPRVVIGIPMRQIGQAEIKEMIDILDSGKVTKKRKR